MSGVISMPGVIAVPGVVLVSGMVSRAAVNPLVGVGGVHRMPRVCGVSRMGGVLSGHGWYLRTVPSSL
ncbi:hypothetical protein [Nocardia otitidiscaviarum]|uniref:hypothetical protein n=1 Tax=Nocardia otitidiscaviarum TaxID=1823 RepID=UPI0003147EE8|nr:hypothetical protein [Nocardia otitidiscaviarum]